MSEKINRALLLIFCLVVLLHVFFTRGITNRENHGDDDFEVTTTIQSSRHSVSYKQSKQKGGMSDFDATSTYLFFAYSENKSVVDAFNDQGDFLFSLSFKDQEKGVLAIQCENEMLYVRLKNDSVMVFDGACLTASFNKQDAEKAGMDYQWFQKPPDSIVLKGIKFYRIDTANHIQHPVSIPGYVVLSYYADYLPLVVVLFVFCIALLRRVKRHRKR